MPSDPLSNALESVLKRFGTLLQTVGRRRGLGVAELDELEQEVRVRLWRALSEHENITHVKTSYVYRAAMSAAVDLIRRRRMTDVPQCGQTLRLGSRAFDDRTQRVGLHTAAHPHTLSFQVFLICCPQILVAHPTLD